MKGTGHVLKTSLCRNASSYCATPPTRTTCPMLAPASTHIQSRTHTHTCIHAHTQAHTRTCKGTGTDIHAYTQSHAQVTHTSAQDTHTRTFSHTHIYTHSHAHTQKHSHTHRHTREHTHSQTQTQTQTHTHTHTHTITHTHTHTLYPQSIKFCVEASKRLTLRLLRLRHPFILFPQLPHGSLLRTSPHPQVYISAKLAAIYMYIYMFIYICRSNVTLRVRQCAGV